MPASVTVLGQVADALEIELPELMRSLRRECDPAVPVEREE